MFCIIRYKNYLQKLETLCDHSKIVDGSGEQYF